MMSWCWSKRIIIISLLAIWHNIPAKWIRGGCCNRPNVIQSVRKWAAKWWYIYMIKRSKIYRKKNLPYTSVFSDTTKVDLRPVTHSLSVDVCSSRCSAHGVLPSCEKNLPFFTFRLSFLYRFTFSIILFWLPKCEWMSEWGRSSWKMYGFWFDWLCAVGVLCDVRPSVTQ